VVTRYDDDMCPECAHDEPCRCYDEYECPSCGTPGCPGYCDDYQSYNLRPEETGGDPDDDRWQEFKDGVATGILNPDGTQREPDPPEEYEAGPRTEDGGPDDPWALPEGETYDTESPF
jgi:hypothetical protein